MVRGTLSIAVIAVCAACGSGHSKPDGGVDARLEGFDQPDLVCPGDPACASAGDGVLRVGAGRQAYTPRGYETYTDDNGDRQYQKDEPFVDLNGNGKFDGVWLFGGGRAAMGATTEVDARSLAFVQGDITIAIVYVDTIGLIAGDMDLIRQHPMLAGLDLDHVIVGATHAHDAPDAVGLWGPTATETGRQPFVMQAIYDAAAQAVKTAVMSARPATMVIASTRLLNDPANPNSLTDHWNKDIRDPVIFDPTLTIARFVDAAAPAVTIGTLVNWANHPEVAHFSETDPATITAHYPHWLRMHVEQGVTTAESIYAQTDLAGLGGVTVFVQGAVGGQIGSLRGTAPRGPDGTPITEQSHAMDQAIGTNAAARALTALATTGEAVSDLPLSLKSAVFNARIENTLFHVAFLVQLLGPHPLVGYDAERPLEVGNFPWLPLRATYLQIGPLALITIPGELHPELWVGGYDGSWSWGWPLYDPSKPNPPLFDQAPPPPYMRDLVLAHDGVRYPIAAGCAEDYMGYIIPAYNYALDPNDPYLVEAAGDHYEEVYSLGPLVEQHAVHPILQLLQYRR
ncbi:MAG: hypothetical protein WKG01_03920 [Kofleriaceae bacterium]